MSNETISREHEHEAMQIDALNTMVQNLSEQNAVLSRKLDSCLKIISAINDQQTKLSEIVLGQVPQQLANIKDGLYTGIIENSEKVINTMDTRIQKTERLLKRRFDALLWNVLFEGKRELPQAWVNKSTTYDYTFYLNNRYHSMVSAQHILQPLFQKLPHKSVVDFGCGTGTWLWVALALGAEEISGYDGDYVPRDLLMIPQNSFTAANLGKSIKVCKTFDLAISMEVAEHLSADSADIFVENIANSSNTVLFSAAHPGQGGDNHINEQPMEYWIEKYKKFDFKPVQIKQYFQDDEKISKWYRQNAILFIRQ